MGGSRLSQVGGCGCCHRGVGRCFVVMGPLPAATYRPVLVLVGHLLGLAAGRGCQSREIACLVACLVPPELSFFVAMCSLAAKCPLIWVRLWLIVGFGLAPCPRLTTPVPWVKALGLLVLAAPRLSLASCWERWPRAGALDTPSLPALVVHKVPAQLPQLQFPAYRSLALLTLCTLRPAYECVIVQADGHIGESYGVRRTGSCIR